MGESYVVHDEHGNPVTYAIKNITSVTTGTYQTVPDVGHFRDWAGVYASVGLFALLLAFSVDGKAQKGAEDVVKWIYVGGGCLAAAAIYGWFFEEQEEQDEVTYYYAVDIVTASGRAQSYTSPDKEEIDSIVNALNEAIING